MSKLFQVGSDWRHRNTGLLVYILEIRKEGILLSARDSDAWDRFLLKDFWSTAELLREFELVDSKIEAPSAWDRIASDRGPID